ncbi:peptidoglycan/xylan/chitin deacetylase (PgdA/CDA1 family) [Kitasatospora sp. MAA19]|uniref:polysaccharide deacetylase family protein n=1 Tax=unclassified Kitasatospora TaxID=2633591 RepID=UPI002473DF0C|nr:polysaccharide deacetylase family protein [Kitasatospora sp. MAA19]MDH6704531.1 peptidoglycan/xylan/chitin deacetylase (PgdA/CDA1 family) [Kitasatospora sp. MAA19]
MNRDGRSRTRTYAVGALALLALATGCGDNGGGAAAPAGGGTSAAGPRPTGAAAPTSAAGTPAPTAPAPAGADAAAWAKWNLKPLAPAPAPPTDKPIKLERTGTVPVFSEVKTTDKVVFITIDDGAEKDPKFVEMLTELKVPISMFLTRDIVKNDYGYFKPLQALGNHIQNHTVDHPVMSKIPAEKQKSEICDAQSALTQQYGTAPLLFRPPFGDGANTPTLNNSVQQCGPRAIVLWRESMQIHDMQYQAADKKLKSGDIILAHFRGPKELKGATMTQMFGDLLARIQEQGFSVARLEDYIQAPAS